MPPRYDVQYISRLSLISRSSRPAHAATPSVGSEHALPAARQNRSDVYVATKIPPKNQQWPARNGVPAGNAFPADWIVESTERSLRNPANAIRAVDAGVVDTVQVIYNVFDQTPEDELFPATMTEDVGVIVRVPFDEGGLTGGVRPGTGFPDGDFRARYFEGERKREVWERVQEITRDVGVSDERIAGIALRFCLSQPAVSTVIAGMRSVRNVERNVEASNLGPLTDEQLTALRRHRWVRNFYP